jgi:hypothetical protein
MKITRKGIRFKYHGDELLRHWPWSKECRYESALFPHIPFDTLNDYWFYCGAYNEACRKKKVIGYTERDILIQWAAHNFRHDVVIILRNVNVIMKNTIFWKSIDSTNRKELLKEVPVLFFKDLTEAWHVFESIDPEFSEAYYFANGKLIGCNTLRSDEIPAVKQKSIGNYPGPR